jgi:hypothetical protein
VEQDDRSIARPGRSGTDRRQDFGGHIVIWTFGKARMTKAVHSGEVLPFSLPRYLKTEEDKPSFIRRTYLGVLGG